MLGTTISLDRILDDVAAEKTVVCNRLLSLFDGQERRSPGVLFRCPASWTTQSDPRRTLRHGSRHETLRRQGRAPSYPRPIDLTRGTPGKLEMYRDVLVLEPSTARTPGVKIKVETLHRVTFYADCAELIHGIRERTLIQCEAINDLDLKFEAHYFR